jgi:hypothetical protein
MEHRVKLRYVRSGGLAGRTRSCRSEDLPPEERAELERLLAAAALPEGPPPEPGGDREQCWLVFEDEEPPRRVCFEPHGLSGPLRALVRFLDDRARDR